MKSSFLRKRALDALNIELNRPSAADDPRADDTYTNPFRGKGTEMESLKRGSIKDLTLTSLRYFQQMASRHPGLRPRILAHCERLTAAIDMHDSPSVLPPRHDLRRHIDDDLQKELDADKVASKKVILTPEQVKFYEQFQAELADESEDLPEDPNDEQWLAIYKATDEALEEQYPELKGTYWEFPRQESGLAYDAELAGTADTIEQIRAAGCTVVTEEAGGEVVYHITAKNGQEYGPMVETEVFWFLKGYTNGRGKHIN